MNNRIAPMTHPLPQELQSSMNKVFPNGLPSPNLYRIVAKHEDLFKEFVEAQFITKTGLYDRRRIAPELREKIILRTCVATGNDYEFNLHIETISQQMGLSALQIEDIQNEVPDPNLWNEVDLILLQLIDQLVTTQQVDDELAHRILNVLSEKDIIEITLLIGFYCGVAFLVAFAKPEFDNYKRFTK